MDAVGAGGDGDVGPVIHHEERAIPIRCGAERFAPSEQIARFGALLAQLDDIRAGFEHGTQERLEIAVFLTGAGDHIQTSTRKALPPLLTETRHHQSWAPLWDVRRDPRST